jgi:hypothetical protein
VWPPPEVEALIELAPDKVPKDVSREDMRAILDSKSTWPTMAALNTAAAVQAAIVQGDLSTDVPRCPVLDITPTSNRFLKLYNRVQPFTGGMGGIAPPGADLLSQDVRTLHAFATIGGEAERIRKAQRDAVKEGE